MDSPQLVRALDVWERHARAGAQPVDVCEFYSEVGFEQHEETGEMVAVVRLAVLPAMSKFYSIIIFWFKIVTAFMPTQWITSLLLTCVATEAPPVF